jgi:hypothetical protein
LGHCPRAKHEQGADAPPEDDRSPLGLHRNCLRNTNHVNGVVGDGGVGSVRGVMKPVPQTFQDGSVRREWVLAGCGGLAPSNVRR